MARSLLWLALLMAAGAGCDVCGGDRRVQAAFLSDEASRPAGFPRITAYNGRLLVAWTRWRNGVPQVVVSEVALAALAKEV